MLGGVKSGPLIVRSITASYNYAAMTCSGRPTLPNGRVSLRIICGTRRPRRFSGAVAMCYGTRASPLMLGVDKSTGWLVSKVGRQLRLGG